MKTFFKLLALSLIVGTTNNFVWFALTFWVFLETNSVISTSLVGGGYAVAAAFSGFWFGAIVDNYKKKYAMLGSSVATLVLFTLGLVVLALSPESAFTVVASPMLWIFAILLLAGAIAGNIVYITVPTLITSLIEEDRRDRANGMFGTVTGISFALTSLASGITLAFLGMFWVMVIAIALTLLAIVFLLLFINIPENKIIPTQEETPKKVDIKGTIKVVGAIPGLFALIFFTTFNNFLGGVFMALMDAYGLTLVSVQVWGTLWAFISFGFIFGGLAIAKWGLGKNPLKTLFRIYLLLWTACIIFPIQPSIVLVVIGAFIWLTVFPFIEATEHTIVQKVVPPQRQGRVFGFAQSIEQAATPLTAFMIGPIAQIIFIPFMTTGAGVNLIGDWFGVGMGRGIALVFIASGLIGLFVTLIAMRSKSYQLLSQHYLEDK